jgi:uncharacterized protein with PIN domain
LIFDEPDAAIYEAALNAADHLSMSTATVLECATVLSRRFGKESARLFDAFLSDQEIAIIPFDKEQLALARARLFASARGGMPPRSTSAIASLTR